VLLGAKKIWHLYLLQYVALGDIFWVLGVSGVSAKPTSRTVMFCVLIIFS